MSKNFIHSNFLAKAPELAELLNTIPGVYYRLQVFPTSALIYASRGVLPLLGYQQEELLNKTEEFYQRMIHPEDKDLVCSKRIVCQASKESHTIQYRILDRKHEIKWVKDQFVGTWDANNNLITIDGHVSEIPFSKFRGQLLLQLQAYRDAIDVNTILSVTDITGTIITANENFCKVSQYSLQELVGQNHRIVCSGYHTKEFFGELWRKIASGKLWHGEILNRAKDGTLYWVDTVIIPILNDHGKITNYLSLRTLITKRKEAEKQKDRYITLLEEIAGMVAHRMRGPLCSIMGLVTIISDPNTPPEHLSRAIVYLREASNQLDQLTHDLSSKIYSNEVSIRAQSFRDEFNQSKPG